MGQWLGRDGPRPLRLAGRWIGLLCVCVVAAAGAAWFIERQVTGLLLDQVLARAVDQVELGIVPWVSSVDFEPPFTPAKFGDLSTRLEPMLARIREQSSGVIRVNVFARDGTVLYSDLASLRGQVVSPLSDELLRQALAGFDQRGDDAAPRARKQRPRAALWRRP